MLIEIYKGIEINHNAVKDEFYTNVLIKKAGIGKKDEYITGPRLQRVRDDIDKFLNTAAKKPTVKKAWYKGRGSNSNYTLVDIIIYNAISGEVMVQEKNGRPVYVKLESNYRPDEKLYLSCKENDAIIALLVKKQAEIDKINKETSCSSGKLIPLNGSHFK